MRHLTYDEPEGISMRRPGMGIDTAILNMGKNIEGLALKWWGNGQRYSVGVALPPSKLTR